LRMKMRWQHMKTPVKTSTAGTRPMSVHKVSVAQLNRPKCRLVDHPRASLAKRKNLDVFEGSASTKG